MYITHLCMLTGGLALVSSRVSCDNLLMAPAHYFARVITQHLALSPTNVPTALRKSVQRCDV